MPIGAAGIVADPGEGGVGIHQVGAVTIGFDPTIHHAARSVVASGDVLADSEAISTIWCQRQPDMSPRHVVPESAAAAPAAPARRVALDAARVARHQRVHRVEPLREGLEAGRLGPLPTLLERDANLPPLETLLGEVARVRTLQAEAGASPALRATAS